jgi:hypothetical protein
MKGIVDHDRFEDVQHEVALRAGEADSCVVAMNLNRDHGHRLALSRVDFSGMIDQPGSFSGRRSSPRPQRGPEASQRMSLAIFRRISFIQPSGALSTGDLALSARRHIRWSVQN